MKARRGNNKVSIPYRFNERKKDHGIADAILMFQFLIGSMKAGRLQYL
ncbi:MAG: hypothetical protein JETT_0424 [Candidatus Jettenia ecosi]|uniref:Uncharacterized protein n=1 Tax=Candidatus Jettenia ecosi TaxID=2494326 RepID=A0A533QER3_9BACT|nr:MAG: hypothetical protein JETT_0424 [Candidatus Jettenia ecosi]